MLKKYVWFVGSFILAFIVLQILSGLLLTMLYTPSSPSWDEVSTLPSQVEFGSTSAISPLLISLTALGISFGITKLVYRRGNNN